MNIYFSCSLTGGREFEEVYGLIVDHLVAHGHDVLTEHLARPEVMVEERIIDPNEVFQRDINWIHECDVLIAEVSTPSHGVGYEIACALWQHKPVLCCYKEGTRVSKMLTGNDTAGFEIRTYREVSQVLDEIDGFLSLFTYE
ncbi:MAG: deoxyribonucleoside 5'-monophosphate N-glycosidase [Anaerolineales bacterium]|nr:deoxyribonucleoside 5'-monophosphate N-glycosidase [Anaerolineales bacterium]